MDALSLTSAQAQALSRRARDAIGRRDWQTLQQVTSLLLSELPHDAETLFFAGMEAKARGATSEASQLFQSGLEFAPKRHDLMIELANQRVRMAQHSEAFALLDRASAQLGSSPFYSDLAATLFVELGLPERALPLAETAHRLQPEVEVFAANLAVCCGYMGDTVRAVDLYQTLLSARPNNRRNHYFLSRLGKVIDDQHVQQMKHVLHDDPAPDARNIFLFFALGKETEDLGLWDEAYDWYARGCRAVKGLQPNGLQIEINKLVVGAGADIKAVKTRAGTNNTRHEHMPIFVVGLPRTGSTIVERVLASHSSVQSVGETRYFEMALQRVFGSLQSAMADCAYGDPSAAREVAETYLSSLAYRLDPRPYFVEKLPLNFNFVPAIAAAFPEAKFVYSDRRPEATCFSMFKQLFTDQYLFSYDLEDLATYFLEHQTHRQRFKRLLESRWIEVPYEELVTDPQLHITRLLEGLLLPVEPACFSPEQNSSASMTASSVQVREPINGKTRQSWRHFEGHLQPLLAGLNPTVNSK